MIMLLVFPVQMMSAEMDDSVKVTTQMKIQMELMVRKIDLWLNFWNVHTVMCGNHDVNRPIPGKVKLLLISGKKSPSLLDHISRFLSNQFVTWYLRSISKTKIVKLFCPCMSEHMIYTISKMSQTWPKRYTKMSQMWPNKILHQKKSWR